VPVSNFAAASLETQVNGGDVCRVRVVVNGAKVERARRKIEMTASRHRYHGYELVLQRKDDDRYQVTIFDPKGKRTASTGIHLERQGALSEASQYISQLLAKRRASLSIS
jgi:hypothetical protein